MCRAIGSDVCARHAFQFDRREQATAEASSVKKSESVDAHQRHVQRPIEIKKYFFLEKERKKKPNKYRSKSQSAIRSKSKFSGTNRTIVQIVIRYLIGLIFSKQRERE